MEPAVYIVGSNCQQCTGMDSLSGYWHIHCSYCEYFCELIKFKFLSGVLRIATMNTIQRYRGRTIANSNSEGHIHTVCSRQEFLFLLDSFASCRSISVTVRALRMHLILLFQILFWSKMLNYFRSLTRANYIYFHFCSPFLFEDFGLLFAKYIYIFKSDVKFL